MEKYQFFLFVFLSENFQFLEVTFSIYFITETCLYNFDPLKPHFYIGKLGFTGVYIVFLFLFKNIDCKYSLKPPQQSMFWAEL